MPSGTMTAQSAIPARASGNSHSRRYAAIQSKIGNNLRATPAKSAEKFDMVRPTGHEPTTVIALHGWHLVATDQGPYCTIRSLRAIPSINNKSPRTISTNLDWKSGMREEIGRPQTPSLWHAVAASR